VILDYYAKTVTLAYPDLPRLVWKSASSSYLKGVISFLHALYMMGKGCLSYLTYVCDLTKDPSPLEAMRVVKEFMDVFPTNLLVFLLTVILILWLT